MPEYDNKPVNLRDMKLFEVEEIDVVEWHPEPDGRGKPEQVHILYKAVGRDMRLIVRLKSRRILDELAAALIEHGDAVWPPK